VQRRHAVPNQAMEMRRPVSAFLWLRVKNELKPDPFFAVSVAASTRE